MLGLGHLPEDAMEETTAEQHAWRGLDQVARADRQMEAATVGLIE
jgi:hypothetical protein